MHHPPEVRFLVEDSPWPRRLLGLVGLLSLFQAFWWVLLNPSLSWRTTVIVTSLLAAVGFAWVWTQRSSKGILHWDGMQWQWTGFAGGACTLQRHLDFQTLMLVSVRHLSGPPFWLWLQRSEQPLQWLALRRAVVYTTSPEAVFRNPSVVSAYPPRTP